MNDFYLGIDVAVSCVFVPMVAFALSRGAGKKGCSDLKEFFRAFMKSDEKLSIDIQLRMSSLNGNLDNTFRNSAGVECVLANDLYPLSPSPQQHTLDS
jgi:hypothetical protein